MSNLTIIIVEDEFLIQADYQRAIAEVYPDANIFPLPDSSELVATYTREAPDLIITDLVMDSNHEGISGIQAIRKRDPDIPIIVASGSTYLEIADAFDVSLKLQKPVSDTVLINAIKKVVGNATN